ncbi:MAG TPA: nucleotidyltransferase family protein [Marinagarivorans sp.]
MRKVNYKPESLSPDAPIGFLVLAAGHSRRFGRCKLSATIQCRSPSVKQTVLGAVLDTITSLKAPVCVVTSAYQTAVIDIVTDRPVQVSLMAKDSDGMGQSIAYGVRATQHWRGWIVCLGDMPWVARDTYEKVLAQANRGAQQAAPYFEGKRGHPVYFSGSYGKALMTLSGDTGAASIIEPAVITPVDIEDTHIFDDVDRPEDLAGSR